MTNCTRFEDEGLLALERGEALSKHFSECVDCIEAQSAYLKLKNTLALMNADEHPADDWQQKVLQSIRQSQQTTRRTITPLVKIAASVAMITITALLLLQFNNLPNSSEQLIVAVVSGSANYRGAEAKVGDSLQLSFDESNAKYSELRVYLDSRIHFLCNSECIEQNKDLSESVLLEAVGEYQSVLIQSHKPIVVPSNLLDADILLAREQGAKVVIAEVIIVR